MVEEATVRVEDLSSKNGTTINGQTVQGSVFLRADDRLAFGSVAAVYRSSASGMSTETRTRSGARAATRPAGNVE